MTISSWPSATPRPAWPPTRASSAMSMPSASWPTPPAGGHCTRSAPPRSGRFTRRCRSARSAASMSATISRPVRMSPLHNWAADLGAEFVETGLWYRSSWFPGRRRRLAGGDDPRSAQHPGPCRACAMCRRSARSTSRARIQPSSSTGLYSNAFAKLAGGQGALWPDAAARTGLSATTAPRAGCRMSTIS